MSRDFAPRGPLEVGQFLDVKAQELAQLQNELQEADEALEDAELKWEKHYDDIISELEEEDDKLPGEDVRISTARRRGGYEMWSAYRRANRSVRRLEKQASITANIISACQSEAKLLMASEGSSYSPSQTPDPMSR